MAKERDFAAVYAEVAARRPTLHTLQGQGADPRSGSASDPAFKSLYDGLLAAAPQVSTTGAASSQTPERQVGGLDWLAVSVRGRWSDSTVHLSYWDRLEAARDEAGREWKPVTVEIGSRKFLVQPYRVAHQNGQAVICCECEGVTYHFSKREQAERGNRPLAWLTMTSLPLMIAGDWWQLWLQAVETLLFLGVRIETTVVSRFDICVDLPGVGMQPFGERYRDDAYICRATKDKLDREHKRVTQVTFGRGLMCRISLPDSPSVHGLPRNTERGGF